MDATTSRMKMMSIGLRRTKQQRRRRRPLAIAVSCLVFGTLLWTTTRSDAFQPIPPPIVPQQQQNVRFYNSYRRKQQPQTSSSSTTALATSASSKTGGKLLETEDDFTACIQDETTDRPVMVFWTAPWCGPCRLSIPVVKAVMKQFAGRIDTCEVCTDELPDAATDAGVVSIPTIHIYFRGRLLDTLVGCVAKQVLAGSVEKVLEDVAAEIGSGADDDDDGEDQSADDGDIMVNGRPDEQ